MINGKSQLGSAPMTLICEVCSSAIATVHVTDLAHADIESQHLCEECAKGKGMPRPRPLSFPGEPLETHYAEMKNHFEEGGTSAELVERWLATSVKVAGDVIGEDGKRKMIAEVTELYERMKKHFAIGGTLGEFADQESRREKEAIVKQFDEARRHFQGNGTAEQLVDMWVSRHDPIVPRRGERLKPLAERMQHHFEQGGSAQEFLGKEYPNVLLGLFTYLGSIENNF